MTDITPYDIVPSEVDASEPARPRVLLTATILVSGAILAGYSTLIGHYAAVRQAVIQSGEVWLPDGVVIPLTQPNFMMLTMVMSVLAMLWAVDSVRHDARANAYMAFALTLVFGLAQILQTGFLISIMEMPTETEPAVLIYSLIAVQVAVMGAAMAYVATIALRTLGGGYTSRDYEGVLAASMFWMMSVGVYLLLWYVVYITK